MNEDPQQQPPTPPPGQPVAPLLAPQPTPEMMPPPSMPGYPPMSGPINMGGYNSPGFGFSTPGFGRQFGGKTSAVIMILFGLVFAAVGYFTFSQSKIPASYSQTTGKVIAEVPRYDTRTINGYSRQVTDYSPSIQFTVNGSPYTFTGSSATTPPSFNVGQTVQVAYNPSDPSSNPKNASDKSSKILSPIFAVLGVLIGLFGIYTFIKSFKSS